MKGHSWVDGDSMENIGVHGLILIQYCIESRFFRVKVGVIHPFVWTTELRHLNYKGKMLTQYCFWGWGSPHSQLTHWFLTISFVLFLTSWCGIEF